MLCQLQHHGPDGAPTFRSFCFNVLPASIISPITCLLRFHSAQYLGHLLISVADAGVAELLEGEADFRGPPATR